MLAHHPAHRHLDGDRLGKRPQLVAEPEQERLARLGFAPRILGQLPLSLGICRNIDEDLPKADDRACLVADRACGTVDPDLSLSLSIPSSWMKRRCSPKTTLSPVRTRRSTGSQVGRLAGNASKMGRPSAAG
jgi:hypothetical protein